MSIEALSMVLNHSKAQGSAKVVLLGIANHLGPDAGEGAWPSQRRLAEYSNMSERGVQKSIDKLVGLGELRVEVATGHSRNQYKPNRYWITVSCPDDCDRSMSHRRHELQYEQGGTPVPSGTNAGTVRDEPQFVLTVIEPLEEPKENLIPSKASRYDAKFEEWWQIYPRKKAKGDAAKEYKKALTKVEHSYLLERAAVYRDDPNRVLKYTPYPDRWLREERWEDEPEAPEQKKPSAVDNALKYVAYYQNKENQREIEGGSDEPR